MKKDDGRGGGWLKKDDGRRGGGGGGWMKKDDERGDGGGGSGGKRIPTSGDCDTDDLSSFLLKIDGGGVGNCGLETGGTRVVSSF